MVASHDGESVALDLELTPILILAGNAREVIRFIQERRKSDGFEISDRITVKWNSTQEIADAIEAHTLHIQDEVLALAMERDISMSTSESEFGLVVLLAKAH
jgi:isoleucyl-tRNA synthetase